MRTWCILVMLVAASVVGFGTIQALGLTSDRNPNVQLALDTGNGEQLVAHYSCPRLADENEGMEAGAEPHFRTIIFKGGRSSVAISTADVPSVFCRSGRYLGPAEISGPFNLVEFRSDSASEHALFIRTSAAASEGAPSSARLEIKPIGSRAKHGGALNNRNVTFFQSDMKVRYASLPVIELSIRMSGNMLTPQHYVTAMNEIRSRITVADRRRLSNTSLCFLPRRSLERALLAVPERDIRRRLVGAYVGCSGSHGVLTGVENGSRIDLVLGRARSAKLGRSKTFFYDLTKAAGDGYLLSCNIPITQCSRSIELSSFPPERQISFGYNHSPQVIDLNNNNEAVAIYHHGESLEDSITFVGKDLQAFDIGGIL